MGVTDSLAIVVILSLVLATCATLGNPGGALPNTSGTVAREKEMQRRAAILARQLRRVRLLLVAGATVLVAGVLEVTSLYSWGATLVVARSAPRQTAAFVAAMPAGAGMSEALTDSRQEADSTPNAAATAKQMASTAGILAGAFYSVLLAAIFIPAFAVLGAQSRALADGGLADKSESEKSTWLTAQGLSGSLPRQLGSLAAVLAPIIVGGPGTALVKALAQ